MRIASQLKKKALLQDEMFNKLRAKHLKVFGVDTLFLRQAEMRTQKRILLCRFVEPQPKKISSLLASFADNCGRRSFEIQSEGTYRNK